MTLNCIMKLDENMPMPSSNIKHSNPRFRNNNVDVYAITLFEKGKKELTFDVFSTDNVFRFMLYVLLGGGKGRGRAGFIIGSQE